MTSYVDRMRFQESPAGSGAKVIVAWCGWIVGGILSLIIVVLISTWITYTGWSLFAGRLGMRPSFLELFFVGISQVFVSVALLTGIVFGVIWLVCRAVASGDVDEYQEDY